MFVAGKEYSERTMMDFIELVKKRRSVRKYLDTPIQREKIDLCVEVARLAPSAQNTQPWRFIIIDDREILKRFSERAFSGIYKATRFASEAPAIAVMLARKDFLANRLGTALQGTQFYLLDMGIAGEHFVLQAAELGIGTCWIGWFNQRKARKFLNIPPGHKIVALISMGYFDVQQLKPLRRKSLEEIRSYNQCDF